MASSPSSTAKLHRLSASFVLGYHGCDAVVADRLLLNEPFKPSRNVWDWLGEGIYFWDANPVRGLEFVVEVSARQGIYIQQPAVVGAVIDLGFCLDLTTSRGLRETRSAFSELHRVSGEAGRQLPENQSGGRHNLDCAVINYLHRTREGRRQPFDTVRGVFIETPELYPGSAFGSKNHIQIAVRNPACIKGVFRVPEADLDPTA
jgi:hypothetical protein